MAESATFGTGPLSGLLPLADYVYSFSSASGAAATACAYFGTADASGTLPVLLMVPSLSVTYATAGTYTAALAVYAASVCPVGSPPAVAAAAQAVAQGSAALRVRGSCGQGKHGLQRQNVVASR